MVEFQILHQDEKINGKGKYIQFGDFNKWSIASDGSPEIYEPEGKYNGSICLRGASECMDNRVTKFKGHHLIPSIHKALELFIKSKYGHCKVIKG